MKYLFIPLLFLLVQCTSEQSYPSTAESTGDHLSYSEEDQMEPPQTAKRPPPPEFELEKGSKIIKNGRLEFEVDHLNKAKASVDTLLKQFDAYYENEQFNAYGNRTRYSLVIRISNTQFDTLVQILESRPGKLVSKNISATDVTEEYVDLNIRLDNNMAYLDQYNQILKKANSIKDILEVQEKIRNIEEEIDSRKGRLKFLDDQVKYSTLNLELTAIDNNAETGDPFFPRIGNAFQNGFQIFLDFIVGLVNLWPFLILVTLFWAFRKRIFRLVKRK